MKYNNFKFNDGNLDIEEDKLLGFQIPEYIESLNVIYNVYLNILRTKVEVATGKFWKNSRGGLYKDPVSKKPVEEVEEKYLIKTYEGTYTPCHDWDVNVKIYIIGECDPAIFEKESKFLEKETLKYLGEIDFDGIFDNSIFIIDGIVYDLIDGSQFC